MSSSLVKVCSCIMKADKVSTLTLLLSFNNDDYVTGNKNSLPRSHSSVKYHLNSPEQKMKVTR